MAQRSTMLFASLVLLLLAAHPGRAQDKATIKFEGNPSSPAAGKINGNGAYTVDCGYTVESIILYAVLTPGPGQGGGDYNVFARITVTNSCSQTLYFDSAVVPVTVK
jgi:hypothetical protein